MSKKSTKIIAVAGVVAGLGVAALPALTFAAPQSVNGQVTLSADVQSAIAMTIHGNGDGENVDGVDVFNPSDVANKEVAGHTTPATAVTGPSSSIVSLLPNAVNTTTAMSTITVYTNDSGYTLSVQDADTDTALKQSGTGTVPTIPALEQSSDIAAGTAAWGFKESGGSTWLAMPASNEAAASITPAASGTGIDIIYGVSTAPDQATGTYTDTIVYTATTIH